MGVVTIRNSKPLCCSVHNRKKGQSLVLKKCAFRDHVGEPFQWQRCDACPFRGSPSNRAQESRAYPQRNRVPLDRYFCGPWRDRNGSCTAVTPAFASERVASLITPRTLPSRVSIPGKPRLTSQFFTCKRSHRNLFKGRCTRRWYHVALGNLLPEPPFQAHIQRALYCSQVINFVSFILVRLTQKLKQAFA